MTVPQEVKLARHAGDLDDDGHDTGATPAAADVSVADAGGYFTATDVEAALAELAKKDIGYQAHGSMGATETFDALTGWHSGTVTASCVITFTGATAGLGASMVLELAVDSGGPYTETWPGSVVWAGSAPTLSASTTYLLLFMSRDGGTTWYGFLSGSSSGASFATPAIVLGTAAAGGAASTTIRSDATIVAFDATVPVTQAFGDAAATGSSAHAARRDHVHGMPATPTGGSSGSGDHDHIIDVFSGDGSTAAFEISNEPLDAEAVFAFVGGSWTAVTVSGVMSTTVTFGSAPGSGTNNVVIQYPAVAA